MQGYEFIHVYESGSIGFGNKRNLDNFLKYLFSCSGNHKENSQTKKNYCLECNQKDDNYIYYFIEDGATQLSALKDRCREKLKTHENLLSDLHYVFFAIKIGKELITNMITIDKVKGGLTFAFGEDVAQDISEKHYNGKIDDFLADLGSKIEKNKGFKFFSDCSKENRIKIESTIHSKIYSEYPQNNILVSISHHDQDTPYHIHRIYEKSKDYDGQT